MQTVRIPLLIFLRAVGEREKETPFYRVEIVSS